jgi:hypothetical protein
MSTVPSTHVQLDEMPDDLRELLRPRVERLGYLGEFFQRAANQPDALVAFYGWTEALKVALPFRLVEVIALSVASRTGNEYERIQHERLALGQGMTRDEVVALGEARAGTCVTLREEELAAAALVRCLLDNFGQGCSAALLRLSRLIGEPEAVACLMLAARYLAHSTMANAWELRAPVESPLAEEDGV